MSSSRRIESEESLVLACMVTRIPQDTARSREVKTLAEMICCEIIVSLLIIGVTSKYLEN